MREQQIVFAPAFFNWAETHRMVSIAAEMRRLGYQICFLGTGTYDYLCKQQGFKQFLIDYDNVWFDDERIKKMMNMDLYGNEYSSKEELENIVKAETDFLKQINPLAIITGYRTTLNISSKIVKIPLIWVLSCVVSPMFYEAGLASMPLNSPVNFIKNIKDKVKQNQMYSRIALSNNHKSKTWNEILERNNLHPMKSNIEVFQGDFNIMSDAKELFNEEILLKNKKYSFGGPILNNEKIDMPSSVKEVIKTNKPKVFISMGSSGDKALFRKLIEWLKDLPYIFFVATTSIISGEENAILSADNIILEKKYPPLEICELCDACVIHGGQGTIYSTIMSGKPYLGIPMFSEQQYNLENIQKFHSGVILHVPDCNKENFIQNLKIILEDVVYKKNAENLAEKLKKYSEPNSSGEYIAAKKIDNFLGDYV